MGRWPALGVLLVGSWLCGCIGTELGGGEEPCPGGAARDSGGSCPAACIPLAVCPEGACRAIDDECGGELQCGECEGGLECDAVRHVCPPCPSTCLELGAECGTIDNGCGEELECGDCPVGACGSFGAAPNHCPCLSRFTDLDLDTSGRGRDVMVGSPFASEEGGETFLYYSSNLWNEEEEPDRQGDSALARVRLLDPTRIEFATMTELPGTRAAAGWVGVPSVRADGLELFFHSSTPDRDYQDEELYVASRQTVGEPWSPPVPIEALGSLQLHDDYAGHAVLLPDDRTLLFRAGAMPQLARRQSTVPGDVAFELLPGPAFEDRPELAVIRFDLNGFTLSCDRSRILYIRELTLPEGAVRIELRELPFELAADGTPSFGTPGRYRGIGEGELDALGTLSRFSEAPDCSTVYLGAITDIYFWPLSCARP